MNTIHHNKIKKYLSCFDIESIAICSRFKIRNSGKISALNFLTSFFTLILGKCYSQRQWAIALSFISNESIAFQSIAKRLNYRTLNFVKSVIAAAIIKNSNLKSCLHQMEGLSTFNRILVEDSTCVKLPSALFHEFPGPSNQNGKDIAMARIQLCVDIKNGDYVNYGLASYRDNDGSYAAKILDYLKPNDLVLRDLAYSSNNIFNQIEEKSAFYIARLKINSVMYTTDNEELISLDEVLRQVERNGLSYFESNYILGRQNKLQCRVICIKLTQAQILKRIRQIKKNGNRNRKPSKKTSYLQTWNILITNIERKDFSGQKIYELYSLRWHIELIFKTWKSYIKLDSIFKSCQGPNRITPEILLYLCLAFIVVIVNPQFKKCQKLIYSKYDKFLSFMKFIKSLMSNQLPLTDNPSSFALEQIYRTCCYDKRKDRVNTYGKILYIFKLG